MPSLAACRCPFRLMRYCFLGKWTCLPVSERFCLVWKCHLFDYSAYIQFCVHWHGGQCLWRLVPNYAVVFRLGSVYLPESLCHQRSRRGTLYIQQLCEDTRCSPEDLPAAMNDRETWRERVRDIRASGTTWWWWWWWLYFCAYCVLQEPVSAKMMLNKTRKQWFTHKTVILISMMLSRVCFGFFV